MSRQEGTAFFHQIAPLFKLFISSAGPVNVKPLIMKKNSFKVTRVGTVPAFILQMPF